MMHLRGPYHGQYPLTFTLMAWMMEQSPSSKSSQVVQRCKQVNVLPVRRGRLENWTKRWLMKFNKEKCEAHLLRRNNPNQLDCRIVGWEVALQMRNSASWWTEGGCEPAVCSHGREGWLSLVYIRTCHQQDVVLPFAQH